MQKFRGVKKHKKAPQKSIQNAFYIYSFTRTASIVNASFNLIRNAKLLYADSCFARFFSCLIKKKHY